MTENRSNRASCNGHIAQAQRRSGFLRQKNGDPALESVASQGQRGRFFIA